MLNRSIFREYDIRGVAEKDLNPENIAEIATGLAGYLQAKQVRKVGLGRDCRESSPRICATLRDTFERAGFEVSDVGLVPTPLLYFSVAELELDAGVMVTGSHNPSDQNGLKMCLRHEAIYGAAIQEIAGRAFDRVGFTEGNGKTLFRDIVPRYLEKVVSLFPRKLQLSVVVDSGNGMGGQVAPQLYRALGCTVTELFSEPDGRFPNHHPDPTVAANLTFLQKALEGSSHHCGIAFDGDADRLGAVDPSGRVIYGDELMVLFARSILKTLPGSKIISDVKATHRLYQDIAQRGGIPIMWKTGHSLMKTKIKEEKAPLAGELSGHIFFADRYYGFDDAIYGGARLLEILDESKQTPAQMLADLPQTFSTEEIRIPCADEEKFKVATRVAEKLKGLGYTPNTLDGVRLDFPDGWLLLRASNTQPVLVQRFEATSRERLAELQSWMEEILESAR